MREQELLGSLVAGPATSASSPVGDVAPGNTAVTDRHQGTTIEAAMGSPNPSCAVRQSTTEPSAPRLQIPNSSDLSVQLFNTPNGPATSSSGADVSLTGVSRPASTSTGGNQVDFGSRLALVIEQLRRERPAVSGVAAVRLGDGGSTARGVGESTQQGETMATGGMVSVEDTIQCFPLRDGAGPSVFASEGAAVPATRMQEEAENGSVCSGVEQGGERTHQQVSSAAVTLLQAGSGPPTSQLQQAMLASLLQMSTQAGRLAALDGVHAVHTATAASAQPFSPATSAAAAAAAAAAAPMPSGATAAAAAAVRQSGALIPASSSHGRSIWQTRKEPSSGSLSIEASAAPAAGGARRLVSLSHAGRHDSDITAVSGSGDGDLPSGPTAGVLSNLLMPAQARRRIDTAAAALVAGAVAGAGVAAGAAESASVGVWKDVVLSRDLFSANRPDVLLPKDLLIAGYHQLRELQQRGASPPSSDGGVPQPLSPSEEERGVVENVGVRDRIQRAIMGMARALNSRDTVSGILLELRCAPGATSCHHVCLSWQ